MQDTGTPARRRPRHLAVLARARLFLLRQNPARLLFIGYLTYALVGWALLSLPVSQAVPVSAIDALFISTSALSTTGLATVDPGSSFSLLGEIVVLLLIQIGGIGYMTISSFAYLALRDRIGGLRAQLSRTAFGLPDSESVGQFVRSVVIFTFMVEAIGTFILTVVFYHRGVENPLWNGLFHSVSAFCTAGFSLFPTSLEAYPHDGRLLLVVAMLSLLGSIGFLIVVDVWRWTIGQSATLGFSSKVILRTTFLLIGVATVVLYLVEPTIADKPAGERAFSAFFQAMSASTTVGFNSIPIGSMGAASLLVVIGLMMVGASPAGTGGGLKTTTFATLAGLVRSVLKGRSDVRLFGRGISESRVHLAAAALAYYLTVLIAAVFVLLLSEQGAAFLAVLFEAVSALSTVGLGMGITTTLSDTGKTVIILLMFAGRLGILGFGIAIASRDRSKPREENVDIVL